VQVPHARALHKIWLVAQLSHQALHFGNALALGPLGFTLHFYLISKTGKFYHIGKVCFFSYFHADRDIAVVRAALI
jgi:hypothetical protein